LPTDEAFFFRNSPLCALSRFGDYRSTLFKLKFQDANPGGMGGHALRGFVFDCDAVVAKKRRDSAMRFASHLVGDVICALSLSRRAFQRQDEL
jgi:hypothetical protein